MTGSRNPNGQQPTEQSSMAHEGGRTTVLRQQFTPNGEDPTDTMAVDLNDLYDGPVNLPNDVADRVRTIQIHSNTYTWPFIRHTLHRWQLSGVPQDVMAQRFNVSMKTISQWKRRLEKDFANAHLEFDVTSMVMESVENLKLLRTEAWQQYTLCSATATVQKASWLDKIRAVEAELHRVMQAAGAYIDEPLSKKSLLAKRNETQHEVSGLDTLKEAMDNFLSTHPEQEIFEAEIIVEKDLDSEDIEQVLTAPTEAKPEAPTEVATDVADIPPVRSRLPRTPDTPPSTPPVRSRRNPEQAQADFDAWEDDLLTPDPEHPNEDHDFFAAEIDENGKPLRPDPDEPWGMA